MRDYGNGGDAIHIVLPEGIDGSGLSFQAEKGGTLITDGYIEVLVLGPNAAGLTLDDVQITHRAIEDFETFV